MSKEKKQTPIMVQYEAIKAEYPDCLLFFRLGDFYELFYEDAKVASSALDIILTKRHKNTADEIPMCGVPAHASENYIARLIKKGFRVAICEQMETPSTKSSKGLISREVVRVITPGTLTEETLLEAKAHNFLMAIYPQEDTVGIASVDISTGDFFMESHPLTTLSSILTRLSPQEILVPDSFLDELSAKECWTEWKKKIHSLPKARFDLGERRLSSFFNVQTIESFGNFSLCEVAAAGALLDYVLVTQKRHVLMLSRPRKLDKNHFLEMDAFTRRSLELLQTFSGDKKGTLLDTIDHTVTAMGARLLLLRLTHPLKNLSHLQERLASVDFFVSATGTRIALREMFQSVSDVERALSRLFVGRASPRDMGAIRTVLSLLPALLSLLHDSSLPPELAGFLASFSSHQPLLALLQKALHLDLPTQLRDGDVIAPLYNETLDELRSLKNKSVQLIEDLQQKYSQETQISTLRIRHNHIIGYYIEVSAAASSKVPFHFILKQSLVSGHRYTTPELTALEQKLVSADDEARTLESTLFDELVEELRQACEGLRTTIRGIAVYDVSCALAELAVVDRYTKPQLDHSLAFVIEGGRHPVVEKAIDKPFMKNNCSLSHAQPIWVMTGPNMAGKSTFLRQNALIALLAHIGSFVPADKSHIGIIDRIFSRVGASDDLARGHSTFMVEMVETAIILNQATEKSFVILDEVGRGTSTYDGLSIAWACVEYLAQRIRCRTLFATHYHELAALKDFETIAFYTLKIKEWERNIVFFHEVIPGVADRSYGVHVARLAGIPDSVIDRAEAILKKLEEE
jgi:DNA mismatch repair protein MutS